MVSYKKLRDGSWGLRADGRPAPGQQVTVTKRDGSTKAEIIGQVLWQGPEFAICSIEPRIPTDGPVCGGNVSERTRFAHARIRARGTRGECQCGACEDLLSMGFKPGERIRCPECGGWAEAY